MLTTSVAAACPYGVSTGVPLDPCADYLHLKDQERIRKDDILGVWIVTGFAEVTSLLRHPGLSSAWPDNGRTVLHDTAGAPEKRRTDGIVRRWFMFNDGERHRVLRRLMAPLFTPERLRALRPFVAEQVTGLLADVDDRVEVMTELAVPLSSNVICGLLGLAPEAATKLDGWARDIAALLIADYLPHVAERGHAALAEMCEAVEAALSAPGPAPESGLALLHRAHRAGTIDEADIAATAALLVYAGFETTSTFVGKAVRAALHTGGWRAMGTADGAAVEELLRFDTSVQQVARVATQDLEVAGRRIPEGDLVLLMLGVANRDPRVFEHPDHLDTGRPASRHLTFGYGAHYCLGAGLARLEAETVLEQLTAKWPSARLLEPVVTRSHHGTTVLESVVIGPERPGEAR